ncbi:MAG: alpha-amylase family glycosyl hydrolase [Planctomycetota bacterium]|nr:alpha-amylase family glycosyl hydrolase [Planctomycetota bacterium]
MMRATGPVRAWAILCALAGGVVFGGQPGAAPAPERARPMPRTPSAYDARDDVFYHFMPIAWRWGEPAGAVPDVAREHRFGNFAGMIDSLAYLESLGVTGVWINPVFPSRAYHGYQHGEADRINPWFGTEEEFLAFVGAARQRGIKVYVDLVAYGISQDSAYFTNSRGAPEHPDGGMLAYTDAGRTQFTGYSFRTWTGERIGFVNWDLRDARARDLVIGWSKRWLDPNGDGDVSDGIAGYRLDHVWARYDKGPDGLGYNIDDFWRAWRAGLETVNPQVFTFAEQAKWETSGADLLATGDGANAHDAAFTKVFEMAAREALRRGKAKPLIDAMERTVRECPPGRTFLAIIGDHDVDRLASAIGADRAETLGRARAAAAVLLLQPFPPVLYYGDEIGMLGKAGNFGSDANDIPRREPMKWLAAHGAPMPDYARLHAGVWEKRYSHDHDGRSVEEQAGVEGSLLETYRALVRARRADIVLRRGSYETVAVDDPGVWVFRRSLAGEGSRLVAINLGGTDAGVRVGGRTIVVPAYGHVVERE